MVPQPALLPSQPAREAAAYDRPFSRFRATTLRVGSHGQRFDLITYLEQEAFPPSIDSRFHFYGFVAASSFGVSETWYQSLWHRLRGTGLEMPAELNE
jgi:hypothetical protein